MDATAFAAYAAAQLADIAAILARHGPGGGACCACGRPDPCPHAETLLRHRAHYRRCLAQAGYPPPPRAD
ncbi:hypothetical protein GCM10010124_23210 [Pilimelia terevasa]|uniref:Uncharacterized protein n=1 Tax=Pilimelia terevasa TaxID=53372 RepID=A0A8J3FHM8_9ACTN|nr:hypothetical protein [Pilimelia terevasa]GGK29849.1 hypothetical protein GCM10010124_23210 [Pilimelia terevasa]